MNKKKIYLWLNEAVSQFIEGACDSFIIVAGGSTATQAAMSPKTIAGSVLIGGAIYVAAFLKKHPTPVHYVMPAAAQETPATPPSSHA